MRFRGAYGYLSIGIQEDIKDSKDKGNIHFVLFRGKIREGGKQEKELRKRGSVSIKKKLKVSAFECMRSKEVAKKHRLEKDVMIDK